MEITSTEGIYTQSNYLYDVYTRDTYTKNAYIGVISSISINNNIWIEGTYTGASCAKNTYINSFDTIKYFEIYLQLYQILKIYIILYNTS